MRSTAQATVMGIAAALLIASTALADTCCANLSVGLDPRSAKSGDTVRLTGMECRNADNTGTLPLNLVAFWLAPGRRPAADPADVPGLGLPAPDLPLVEEWLSFQSAPTFNSTNRGDATITVPDLPHGLYQLWWRCENGGGPGSGIHYSTGPRLALGIPPDTATDPASSFGSSDSGGGPPWLVIALGAAAFMVMFRWSPAKPRERDSKGG